MSSSKSVVASGSPQRMKCQLLAWQEDALMHLAIAGAHVRILLISLLISRCRSIDSVQYHIGVCVAPASHGRTNVYDNLYMDRFDIAVRAYSRLEHLRADEAIAGDMAD